MQKKNASQLTMIVGKRETKSVQNMQHGSNTDTSALVMLLLACSVALSACLHSFKTPKMKQPPGLGAVVTQNLCSTATQAVITRQ